MKLTILGYKGLNSADYKNLIAYTNKEKSSALSFWRKFVNLFKSKDKKEVINTFYELINPSQDKNQHSDLKVKFHRFEQLKHMTEERNREQFKINIQPQGINNNKYTFSIEGNDIYSITSENNWNSLSEISFNQLPLIENYSRIVKQYAKDNQEVFSQHYPTTEITDVLDADTFIDLSCFFLGKNIELSNTLLAYGLTNIDVMDFITDEMSKTFEDNDLKRGELTYTLTTISGSLRLSEMLDSDCM